MEGQSPKQEGESEAQHATEQPLPERKVVPPPEPPKSENATQPAGDEPKKRCWRDKRWRHPQVIVNGALAIITIGIGIIYYFQFQQMKVSSKAVADAATAAKQSVELATTPWIDTVIKDVTYKRSSKPDEAADLPPAYGILGTYDAKGRFANNTIEINYSINNRSDVASPRIYAQCFLEGATGYFDRESSSDSERAIMPRQELPLRGSLLATKGDDPAAMADLINNAKVGIKIYVLFYTSTGKKLSFVETFFKIGGAFTRINRRTDPSGAEIDKMMKDSIPPKKQP